MTQDYIESSLLYEEKTPLLYFFPLSCIPYAFIVRHLNKSVIFNSLKKRLKQHNVLQCLVIESSSLFLSFLFRGCHIESASI